MSARVDPSDVLIILPDVALESGALEAIIADAHAWVEANLLGCGMSEETLASIEKYLAAHLAVQSAHGAAGQVIEEQIDDTRERRQGSTDAKGVSSYLRIAAAFDRCGRIEAFWMGKPRLRFRVGAGYNTRGGGNG